MIGFGKQRVVFEHPDDPGLVIKRALSPEINRKEAENCKTLLAKGLGDWIAHVVAVSDCGTVLMMQRAEPYSGPLPKQIPACFRDLHRGNLGVIDGRLVFVDYHKIGRRFGMADARWK